MNETDKREHGIVDWAELIAATSFLGMPLVVMLQAFNAGHTLLGLYSGAVLTVGLCLAVPCYLRYLHLI